MKAKGGESGALTYLERSVMAYEHKKFVCRKCKRAVKTPTWRMYRNGAVHLVWQCCGSYNAGKPLPSRLAESFGLESKDQATARLTVANDKHW